LLSGGGALILAAAWQQQSSRTTTRVQPSPLMILEGLGETVAQLMQISGTARDQLRPTEP
jgi:hypothetical protein